VTTYYVSAAGSDSNNGTSTATPWQTIGKVNSTVFAAGDAVLFRGGDTFTGMVYIDTGDGGTAVAPLTIGSYGTGKAILSNTSNSACYVDSRAAIIVQDVILHGNPTTPTDFDGLAIYKGTAGRAAFVRLTNVEARGFKNGVSLGGAAGGGFADVVIDGCDLHDNKNQGLLTYGPTWTGPTYAHTNVTIQNTKAYLNRGDAANVTTNSGSGIVLGSCDTGLIDRCTAYSNGSLCTAPEGPAGIWAYDSTGITIQRSLAYSNRTGGSADGDGFDLDIHTSNSTVQYCLAYDNDGAGVLLWGDASGTTHSNNTVRFNLLWGNCRKGTFYGELCLGQVCVGDKVYGNTLVQRDNGATKPPALVLSLTLAGSTGNTIRNNIIQTQTTSAVVSGGSAYEPRVALLQGNRYHAGTLLWTWGGSYNTLATWRAATQQETYGLLPTGSSGDPGLASVGSMPTLTDPAVTDGAAGFKPTASSPVLAAALDLTALFSIDVGTRDYFGAPLVLPGPIGGADGAARYSGGMSRLAGTLAPTAPGDAATEFAPLGHMHPEPAAVRARTVSAAGEWEIDTYLDLLANGHRDDAVATWAFSATNRTLALLLGRAVAGSSFTGFRVFKTTAAVGGTSAAALYTSPWRSATSWTRVGAGNVSPTLTGTGQLEVPLPFTLDQDAFVLLLWTLTGTAPTTYPVLAATPAGQAALLNGGTGSPLAVVSGASAGTAAPAATLNPTTGFTAQTQKPWATLY